LHAGDVLAALHRIAGLPGLQALEIVEYTLTAIGTA